MHTKIEIIQDISNLSIQNQKFDTDNFKIVGKYAFFFIEYLVKKN